MENIEIHQAYFFVCDKCGRDSFGRLLPVGSEERAELQDEYDVEPGFMDKLMMVPAVVSCQHCHERYSVGAYS